MTEEIKWVKPTRWPVLPVWFNVRWSMYMPTFTREVCDSGRAVGVMKKLISVAMGIHAVETFGGPVRESNHLAPEVLVARKRVRLLNNALQSLRIHSHDNGLVVFEFRILMRPYNREDYSAEKYAAEEALHNVCHCIQHVCYNLNQAADYAEVLGDWREVFGPRTWQELYKCIEQNMRGEQWHTVTAKQLP